MFARSAQIVRSSASCQPQVGSAECSYSGAVGSITTNTLIGFSLPSKNGAGGPGRPGYQTTRETRRPGLFAYGRLMLL